MTTSISLLWLIYGITCVTVSAEDLICINNTTCINNEVCDDNGCRCPSTHYGANCDFSITNALVIVLICTLPPLSWLAVCCYGVHSKGAKGLWPSRDGRHSSSSEQEREPQEEIIDDCPPPSYAQIVHYNTAGTFEGVGVMTVGQGVDNVEPPPSYLEWTQKAVSLREQEMGGSSIGLITISNNTMSENRTADVMEEEEVEREDQC